MQIWAESGKSALPICNYSQILYQFLTFTQNLKRSRKMGYTVSFLSHKIGFLCKHIQKIWIRGISQILLRDIVEKRSHPAFSDFDGSIRLCRNWR